VVIQRGSFGTWVLAPDTIIACNARRSYHEAALGCDLRHIHFLECIPMKVVLSMCAP
jgi:hypothetical protein